MPSQVRNIEELKKDFLSDDFEIHDKACEKSGELGGSEILKFLISKLKDKDIRIKRGAAQALRKMGDMKAVYPLLRAIIDPVNKNCNASFVYALQTHDCSRFFYH